MSNKIKVILLEDIPALGRTGEIVPVAEGYARNLLFPEGRAALATEQVRNVQQLKKSQQKAQAEADLMQMQALAQKLDGTELLLSARVKEGEEIFGKITGRMIAEELNRQASLNVRPSDVKVGKPLTALGSRDVMVALSPAVDMKIRVTVVSDGTAPKKREE